MPSLTFLLSTSASDFFFFSCGGRVFCRRLKDVNTLIAYPKGENDFRLLIILLIVQSLPSPFGSSRVPLSQPVPLRAWAAIPLPFLQVPRQLICCVHFFHGFSPQSPACGSKPPREEFWFFFFSIHFPFFIPFQESPRLRCRSPSLHV